MNNRSQPGGLDPLHILRYATEILPATKFAVGVVGLAAAAEIVLALGRSPVFGVVAVTGIFVVYTTQLGDSFHRRAIREMCRVAREVRIFPLWRWGQYLRGWSNQWRRSSAGRALMCRSRMSPTSVNAAATR